MSISHTQIIEATTPQHYDAAKALFQEYRDRELVQDYEVSGGGLDEELAIFPGPYVAPEGYILLASLDGKPCGCLALRKFSTVAGEVVRMYVQPHARGQGIAKLLMQALILKAKQLGYQTLYLDSMQRFPKAVQLYRNLGFVQCAPYDPHTTEAMKQQMVFMQLALEQEAA